MRDIKGLRGWFWWDFQDDVLLLVLKSRVLRWLGGNLIGEPTARRHGHGGV